MPLPTAIPAKTALTDSAVTQGGFKTALDQLVDAVTERLPGLTISKTGGYTLATSEEARTHVINSAADITVNLPACATAGDGFWFNAVNIGAGAATFDGSGAETINGATTMRLSTYESAFFITNGAAWFAFFCMRNTSTAYMFNSSGEATHQMLLGDDSNAGNSAGFTINQGTADDEILSLKSSDVAHGMTDFTETDTYAYLGKVNATDGGLVVRAFTEQTSALHCSVVQTVVDTTKSTSAIGALTFSGSLKSGTGSGVISANGNIAAFRSASTCRFILDAEGDSHQDVGTAWTNFDDFEDVDLLTALSVGISQEGDPIKAEFSTFLDEHRDTLIKHRIVTFNEDGHHFINWSRTHMLTIGAVRQQAKRLKEQDERINELTAQLSVLTSVVNEMKALPRA